MRGVKGGALGWRSCMRCRSFGGGTVSGEACAQSHQRALNRNDSDKGANPPRARVLEVPHVQVSSNDHILLLAHHRVTTEVRVCGGRNHPRGYAADAK